MNAIGQKFRAVFEKLSPKQRQYAALGVIVAVCVGVLWVMLAANSSSSKPTAAQTQSSGKKTVTNLGVLAPGEQVTPADQWIGTAGKKLALYEHDRDEQARLNRERQDFEAQTMRRFSEIEQRLTVPTGNPSLAPPTDNRTATDYPPANALPDAATGPLQPPAPIEVRAPVVYHISVGARSRSPHNDSADANNRITSEKRHRDTVDTFLPVSFTRGVLLGGLDAPTGGQAQSNPQPILIQLSDDSILPNRYRGQFRECFVIAAGYGDISSERAYARTESISCVRADGSTLELKVQGTIYGEDGKVGMRGRLVTKQGQMLANALLAGIVSGIGQGVANSSTNYSTSALGTIATTSGSEAYRAGLGTGVGRALDRLAQYYIKLAENTFPVIEIDAGRTVDVLVTKGVRIEVDDNATPTLASSSRSPASYYGHSQNDPD